MRCPIGGHDCQRGDCRPEYNCLHREAEALPRRLPLTIPREFAHSEDYGNKESNECDGYS